MPCLKKERKPLVPLKTLDILFRRRYLPNTQFYFTNRKHAITPSAIQKRVRPFKVPYSEKLLSYIKYSDRKEKVDARSRLSQPLHLKDNLRVAASRDISKRLFLEEPPDDVRAVVEIHPEFYRVIEGRPIRRQDDIKVYISNIRCFAMLRQQTGYRRDIILRIEKNTIEESVEFDSILEELKEHIKNFQRFLTEDYKKACYKVYSAEKVAEQLVAKISEYLGYVTKLTIYNNILFKLDAIRSILKIYRSYLIFVAPLSWRQQYDVTLRGKLLSIQSLQSGTFSTDNDLVETLDIDKMIENALIELRNPLPPDMFFKNPKQMMYLFRTMELQSREYLIHLSKTNAPHRILQDRIKHLKTATKRELDYFQYYIDYINNEIAREYFNEFYFKEKFYRILYESFYNSVASPMTLKMKICIEFVYEQVFGKCEEGHTSLHDPMKILEVTYEELNLNLDSLDFKIVTQARNEFFAQDLKVMKNALMAERELKAFSVMTNAMNKAFLPPKKFKRPVLKKFMNKKSQHAQAIADLKKKSESMAGPLGHPKKYKITSEEREALLQFTDWCEGENPASFLDDYYTYIVPALTLRQSTGEHFF